VYVQDSGAPQPSRAHRANPVDVVDRQLFHWVARAWLRWRGASRGDGRKRMMLRHLDGKLTVQVDPVALRFGHEIGKGSWHGDQLLGPPVRALAHRGRTR
jgi:hypothetical protein